MAAGIIMQLKKLLKLALLVLVIAWGAASVYVWKSFVRPPWEEEYAYSKGMQAAIYAFPYVLNSSLRWAWSQPADVVDNSSAPSDAINHFFHTAHLTDASYRDGGSPNNDTAYSVTWAYVKDEPLILQVPEIGVIPGSEKLRYYSFELAGFNSDNFAYVGTRATGNGAGNYAIVPPGWQGELPAGVTRLAETPTPWFLIVGRTLVASPEDLPAVSQLIQGYRLVSLSDWGSATPKRPYAPKLAPVPHYKKDKLELLEQFWSLANQAMSENPPAAADARLMTVFGDIEVGPGRDLSRLTPGLQAGLQRASLRALMLLPEVHKSNYGTKLVNGWKYPPADLGRSGLQGQFLTRAVLQSLGGIVANDPDEAVYLVATRTVDGELLNGEHSYRITFGKDNLPPVQSFWSMTLYDSTNNLAANPLNRYSLGDRNPDLKYAEDGSLSFYVGHEPPADELQSNWLPAPDDEFYLLLRTYLPGPAIVEQSWQPPEIELLD